MRFVVCLFFVLFAMEGAMAQTMTSNPKSVVVEAGKSFEIEYSISNADGGQFTPPNLDDFMVLSGPNSFSSTQYVNGKVSSIKRFGYTLAPKKAGQLSLKGAAYKTRKQSYRASTVPVKVTGTMPVSKPQGANNVPQGTIDPSDTLAASNLPDLFYQIEVDTDRIYVGEQLTAYYVLYSTNGITNYSSLSSPAQTGFWVEDITPGRINSASAVFGNRVFQKYVIKKFALFPQRSGSLEIDDMELEVQVRTPQGGRRRGIFQHYSTKNVNVNCKKLPIAVMSLPNGAPEDFKGAVGAYQLNVRPDKKTCTLGESIDLSVGILGSGNLKLIEPLEIPVSDAYEVYDPIVSENIRAEEDLVLGTKTFEYNIIPKEVGNLEIPPLRLSYFNPKTKRYEVKESPRTVIQVVPGDGTQGVAQTEPEEESKLLGIKTGIDSLRSKGRSSVPLYFLGSLFILPFLLMPLVVSRKRKAEAAESDVVGIRKSQASSVAQERLATAKSHISRNNKKDFYTEITKTIEGYCGDKFNVPSSSLSKEDIISKLASKEVPEGLNSRLKSVMEYCEMVLFAPVADADNLQKTYDETLAIITELEEFLK